MDIEELQPHVYTGAYHKWMCAPKGCSFLYVKKEWQHLFDPLLISGFSMDGKSILAYEVYETVDCEFGGIVSFDIKEA